MIALPNDWTCARCIKCVPLKEPSSGFGEKEQLLCSKIYLWCFKYKQITDPFMKFDPAKVNLRYIHIKVVAAKLSQMAYKNIPDFLRDMELVISSAVEIDEAARNHVRLFFKQYCSGVKKYLPAIRT
uniref:Bromo domain-containing protein n=1 Tax=Ditylenchus dipsaci TaxID=166011 RepID=A0A915EMJ3_9BILA